MELEKLDLDTSKSHKEATFNFLEEGKAVIKRKPNMEWSALKLEAKNIQLQLMEDKLNFVRSKLKALSDEKNSLVLWSERAQAETKALKLDRKELVAESKKAPILEMELNVLREQYYNMADQLESYMQRVRRSEAKCEDMKKAIEGKELETERYRANCEKYCKQEEELKSLRRKCENITKERNSYLFRAQREANCADAILSSLDALIRERDDLIAKIRDTKELEEQLNIKRLDCIHYEKQKEDLKLRIRSMGAEREKLRRDMEALRAERDGLRDRRNKVTRLQQELTAQRQECENLKTERKELMMRVQRGAEEREATKKESEALKLERKQLRPQCKNCTELGRQLSAKSERCKQVEEEISALKLRGQKAAAEIESLMEEFDSLSLLAGNFPVP
jgi:chromosome segregation ATPase